MRNKNFITLIAAVILVIGFNSQAKEIPFPLPNHDGLPGDSKKPVKVYILAGQSNMVGMGNLSGAKNMYDGVFLSSDPVTPDSPLQIFKVGNYKTSPLEVFTFPHDGSDRFASQRSCRFCMAAIISLLHFCDRITVEQRIDR